LRGFWRNSIKTLQYLAIDLFLDDENLLFFKKRRVEGSKPSGISNIRTCSKVPRLGLRGIFEKLISSIIQKAVLIFWFFFIRKKEEKGSNGSWVYIWMKPLNITNHFLRVD
jgi:hypothetical protein